MSTALTAHPGSPDASTDIDATTIERVLIQGDLRGLTPAQKVHYYMKVCESVGLNPLTKPFEYLTLNGREVLYALRSATDQLRRLHTVSIQITARDAIEDCYVVSARATLPDGAGTMKVSAPVAVAGLKGEARANAMMKAETKAKRRVTLAICGLGMLDETEVESMPQADHGAVTGEVIPPAADLTSEWLKQITEAKTREALEAVGEALKTATGLSPLVRNTLRASYKARLATFKTPAAAPVAEEDPR